MRPGHSTLADWHAIYRGAAVTLDPGCHAAVAASVRAVEAILAKGEPVYGINTGFGRLASVRIAPADLATLQRNIVLSHAAGVGEPMPAPLVRLMLALKLASLAQGTSGVRPETVQFLSAMLTNDLLPVVPTQGSVGASGDLAPLAHMAAAMIGFGQIVHAGARSAAADALARAGMTPLVLGAKEGLALLNGTQFSTAYALAGLFEAETLLQSGLVTGALSMDAARGSDVPFDPRIHALRRHRGQIDVAQALRALIAGSAIRASHLTGDDRVQDPYCLRCQPQVMGAALDILRHAAVTLQTEANAVSDNPLICFDPPEALSGGNFHGEPVAFAADIIALALCEIGAISERRIAMLIDPTLSRLPAFLTPKPGLNSGFMVPQVTAAALVAENRQRATPASVNSIPTSANQEDHVSMSAHAARRLLAMAENAAAVVGIELLAAAQGCDFHAPLRSSAVLERVRATVRAEVPHLDDDRELAPDIAKATALVRSGSLAQVALEAGLPCVAPPGVASQSHSQCMVHGRSYGTAQQRSDRARSARHADHREVVAHRGAAAHADEQPRSRCGGAPGRTGGLWRHRPRCARLGQLRPHRRRVARLEADQTLLVQSGKPVGVFRTHADAPRVLIANSNLVPHWATWEHFNELDRKGLMMYGQMTAGSWIYIGSQGIVQGTYETFVEVGRRHYGGDLAGRWILTAGLGGMGGAQPLAATMAGASCWRSNASRAGSRCGCGPAISTQAADLDEALAIIERACARAQAGFGRRCWATPPRCCPSCCGVACAPMW